MVTGPAITFIDFGNLYTLNGQRDDGVNEKTELLRVIVGAAHTVATKELNLNFLSAMLPANVVDAIVKDAKNLGGDKDYKIEIGV